ncbi:hypothetical protein [Campylobacter helveticus]|uniref:hypothetical protein n=1 Tax=Campylobacter helveticus TaxID=28898 RepID=UPI002942E8F5|nr:hypothetical protein [Campylobacter helveticus]
MSEKVLEIFKLCERLVELLGDKEAIADLKLLYEHHPEMFEDREDVLNTIEEVVSNPEIIMRAKREGAILASKRLQNMLKMGDVVIENDNGTNIIFHVNKKRIKEFEKLKNSLVETPTPSTHRSKSAGELIGKNLSGANAHSANFDNNIPQPLKESQAKNNNLEAKVSELLREQESISSMPRAKDFNKNFQKDLEESFGMKLEDLKDESKNKPKIKS